MKNLIKKLLAKRWLKKYGITNYTINASGEIDVDGDVNLTYRGIKKLPSYIQFGKVNGYFTCSLNKLTSLKGAAKEVGGIFNCSYNKLTSLEGAPKNVIGSFACEGNTIKFTKDDVNKICKVGKSILV